MNVVDGRRCNYIYLDNRTHIYMHILFDQIITKISSKLRDVHDTKRKKSNLKTRAINLKSPI